MKQLRAAAASRNVQTLIFVLSEARSRSPVAQFSGCVAAFRRAAPIEASRLLRVGPTRFKELVWERPPLRAMSLERELAWACCWLHGQSAQINRFREFALRLQQSILDGRLSQSATELDEFIGTKGWSLWAVELRMALEQFLNGTDAQKEWSSALQATAPNSIGGLLAQIFSDRNDESFSFAAFISKCQDSFPRFSYVESWVPSYLMYRATANVEDESVVLAAALAREATSSLVDYYEVLVDAIATILFRKSPIDLRQAACSVAAELLDDGFVDHRLNKLLIGFGGRRASQLPLGGEVATTRAEAIARQIYCCDNKVPSGIDAPLTANIFQTLVDWHSNGMAAKDAFFDLLRLGANFKSLDVGMAIYATPGLETLDLLTTPILSINAALLSPCFRPEDIASFPDDEGKKVLLEFAEGRFETDAEKKALAISLLTVLDSKYEWPSIERPSVLHLWLGRQLLLQGRYAEAQLLAAHIKEHGSYWARQSAKLRLWGLSKQAKISEALELAAEWLLENPEYVFELPIKSVFEHRTWQEVRDLDPIVVGLVAHHAYAGFGDSSVAYICKMACRKIAMSGIREELPQSFGNTTSAARRLLIIAFFRDVWIEENLAMNHLLESTDDVRHERLEVLQLLLQWDESNRVDYVEAIKDLTFDGTLRQGLRSINETRVFVNESAITRWAEKELLQDFERWKKLSESVTGSHAVDDMLRQYAVDPDSIALLKAFGSGKPTEADALLIHILERLYKRFLLDPTDGLDCYLSLRIRHGSLRGTLFGPLEEQGLLYSTSDFSKDVFEKRWGNQLSLYYEDKQAVLEHLGQFTKKLKAIADELVNERIHVHSTEKPKGVFLPNIAPEYARLLTVLLTEKDMSFYNLIYSWYYLFWKALELPLADLAAYIRTHVKEAVQMEFDAVVTSLRTISSHTLPLVTALRTIATTTQSQCDAIADWFSPPGQMQAAHYELSAAIEIAKAATMNVHRAFPANVRLDDMPEENLPLSTSALAVLTDCLFVVFENALKHSGLGVHVGPIALNASFDAESKLLTLAIYSNLSEPVRNQLLEGGEATLRTKYLSPDAMKLIRREGGSGLAKLARLSRSVDRSICAQPFNFGVKDGRWYTNVTIPLYERAGVYEAIE